MSAVAGRTTDPRTVTINTTTGQATVTAAAGTFQRSDAGRKITGTGIPAAATVLSVQSATAATLSANATATGSPSVVLGLGNPQSLGFQGFSPESEVEADSYTIAGGASATSPGRLTNSTTSVASLQRSRA